MIFLTGIQHLEKYLKQLQKEATSGNVGTIFSEARRRTSRAMGMSLGLSLGNAVHKNLEHEASLLSKVNKRDNSLSLL